MKVKKKFKIAISALAMLFAFSACAGMPTTMKGKYLLALDEFTEVVTSYNASYKLQTATTQAKWKSDFDPIFIKVNTALNAWGLVVGTTDAGDKQALYITAFSKLKSLLLATGLIEIKEKG